MRTSLRIAQAAATAFVVLGAIPNAGAQQPACTTPKTTCGGADGYYASTEDVGRVTAVVDPLLRELRTCFDAAGGKHITPTITMRWDSEGKPVGLKVDAPGYETLPCVAKVSGKLAALQNPHETAIRCDYGCAKPPPPAPAPAPIVVPPPAPTTQAPPPTAQQQQGIAPPPKGYEYTPKTEKVWYGWQTLIADAVSIPLFLTGLAVKNEGVTVTGYLSFVLAAPIVHMVHGNVGRGFASIGMRLLIPITALGIGAIAGLIVGGQGSTRGSGRFADFGDGASDVVTGAVIGAGVGAAGCVLLDAAVLGYAQEKVAPPAAASPKPIQLRPYFDVARGSFGVGGTF